MTDDRKAQLSWWRDADQKRHRNYTCRMCGFSTLRKDKFEQHIIRRHPPLEVIDGGKADAQNSAGETGEKEN